RDGGLVGTGIAHGVDVVAAVVDADEAGAVAEELFSSAHQGEARDVMVVLHVAAASMVPVSHSSMSAAEFGPQDLLWRPCYLTRDPVGGNLPADRARLSGKS